MSDYTNKSKPLLEKIASMLGNSKWLPIFAGGSGQALTVHDVSAAVACARQTIQKPGRKDPIPMPGCVRTELLMLKWGERVDVMFRIAKACGDALLADGSRKDVRLTRSAALLAAQLLRGRQADIEVSSWALVESEAAVRREVGAALAWMNGELSEAERAYLNALRTWEDWTADPPKKKLRKAA